MCKFVRHRAKNEDTAPHMCKVQCKHDRTINRPEVFSTEFGSGR